MAVTRSEVSGARLWGWARARYADPRDFFARFFVLNYCPLVWMEASGRNRTPDQLPAVEQAAVQTVCDRALAEAIAVLRPVRLVGVGGYAEARLKAVAPAGLPVGRILHPSPANPAANRDWAGTAERQLHSLGAL